MDSQQYGYYNIIIYLDRGLQSSTLADVLAVVRSCPCYVENMPFPTLVNAVLLRLSETFQGEKFNPKLEQFLNVVRLNIIKSVREFRRHLHVAFSSDEIVRSVMKVSHSNDFHARSLTLLFLAALAPLISENKKVHHLLIESLDCGEESELSAAIFATTEFGRNSSAFCSLVVEKIGNVLCSSQICLEVKLRLLNVLANFKESYAVARTSFHLCAQLLRCNVNSLFHAAVLDASTRLAARSCLVIGEQISLLLAELDKAIQNSSNMLILCLLRNLARLAHFPQHWQSVKVTNLRDIFERLREINSQKINCAWLNCMEVFTSTSIHCDAVIEKNFSWIALLRSEDMKLRISGIRLLMNIMRNGSSKEHFRGIFLFVVVQTIVDFQRILHNTKLNEVAEFMGIRISVRLFYKSISAFAKMPQCTAQNALSIVHELTRSCTLSILLRDQRTITDGDLASSELLSLIMQALCSVCDAHPAECAPFGSQWALSQFLEFVNNALASSDDLKCSQKIIGELPFSLYNLMLMNQLRMTALSVKYENDNAQKSFNGNLIMEEDNETELIILDDDDNDNNVGGLNCRSNDTKSFGLVAFLEAFERISVRPNLFSCTGDEATAQNNGWTRFKIARCAFHYGHWLDVALPLLETIRPSCDSMETSSWINALINIAKSQVNGSEFFSVNRLNESYKYLRNAFLILQRLAMTPRRGEHSFAFAASYTNCLAMSWQAIRLMLSTFNVKLLTLAQYQNANTSKIPEFCVDQLCAALTSVRMKLTAAHAQWVTLFHRSFDADASTLVHIHLWTQFMLLLENVLLFLCAQPTRLLPLMNSRSAFNFGENAEGLFNTTRDGGDGANYNFNELLHSFRAILDSLVVESNADATCEDVPKNSDGLAAKSSLTSQSDNDVKRSKEGLLRQRLTHENLVTAKEMLLSLKHFSPSLPRFFFQRIFYTQIKLNVSPTSRENDGVVSITSPLLPLTVEGVIQSNNAKRIEHITIITELNSVSNNNLSNTKPFVDKRVIEVDDGESYFKTQFLLKIAESVTKIHVRLLFTDAATKCQWVDESAVAELTVQYHDAPQN